MYSCMHAYSLERARSLAYTHVFCSTAERWPKRGTGKAHHIYYGYEGDEVVDLVSRVMEDNTALKGFW
jgi:hypothetical protein